MSDFKANVVGMEYHNISGTGWPDSAEVENEGDILAGTYESRRYVPERTCRVVSHSVFCGSFGCEEAGERWELSCGHEALTEYDRPGYCPECGARLVEP